MLTAIAVSGYRSLREIVVPLSRVTVVTGPNGSGKSSLYRSLRLLADAAQGRLVASLAQEGGLASTLWAGPERISLGMRDGSVPVQGTVRRESVALKLGFSGEGLGYAVDLGMPIKSSSAFGLDPEYKLETVFSGPMRARPVILADRRGPAVRVADDEGRLRVVLSDLAPYDGMLTHAADPRGAPELLALRERMRRLRFYDHLRTDPDAPMRGKRVGTRTPVLASDGGDLAAALQTIREIGDGRALDDAVADAFDGARVEIGMEGGLFETAMRQPGLLRPLGARELSDGTLRYLALVAALLSPRPPELLVLNEPETSLHPDLIAPLARLVVAASARTQVLVVTHAAALAEALARTPEAMVHRLEKSLGETRLADDPPTPIWIWPKR
ncbi:AAA family ATPase [Salinarimonas ramus]|uniref:ATP-binding protein n=1 Tax=Salinarimonas ramus TaxID=690164 RepID=A0A917V234_9HYPH|nr:AAA family ATPase [Salinarimonas ramus]GGK18505.1 ATP-binding protein [Salinarimonas ramus]